MIKSFCEIHNLPEVRTLKKGMDFRKPEYRRELFSRFYEFHTSYGIHPGLVYLFLPELAERNNWSMEQRFWAAFLEGCTENPCTVWQVMQFFPKLPRTNNELGSFKNWHKENWKTLQYDIDVRYNKGHLVEQVESYLKALGSFTQEEFFSQHLLNKDKKEWYNKVWDTVTSLFYKYGRRRGLI